MLARAKFSRRLGVTGLAAVLVVVGGLGLGAAFAGSTGPTWGSAINLDESATAPAIVGLSCVSTSWCLAANGLGQGFGFNATSWSSSAQVDSNGTNGSGATVTALSCTSTTFCAASDDSGYATVFNGTSWSTPALLDGSGTSGNSTVEISSVSCASGPGMTFGQNITICWAVDVNGLGFEYSSSTQTWSSGVQVVPKPNSTNGWSKEPALTSVSCPSTGFCVAVDNGQNGTANEGDAYTWDGTSWSAPSPIDTQNGGGSQLNGVSCTSTSFCVAVGNAGEVLSYNGTTWSSPQVVDDQSPLSEISCASTTLCVATINAANSDPQLGGVVVDQGGTWASPQMIDIASNAGERDFASVTCPSTTFCVAGDHFGDLYYLGTPGSTTTTTAAPASGPGYWLLGADGTVYPFGSGKNVTGDATNAAGAAVAITSTPDGLGYWVALANGTLDNFGDAPALTVSGSVTAGSVVAIASTKDGKGLWMATSGGQVLVAGDATSYGSPAQSGINLAKGVVAMTVTADGKGYWLLGGDGGVFSYGDASFFGSSGQINPGAPAGGSNSFVPNKPITAIVATATGKGYWMVGADGGVFAFGDAGFVGSLGGGNTSSPIVGFAPV